MDLQSLQEKINYHFKNEELLKRALTHRSYLNEVKGGGVEHNERSEFLGDAVLELVVTEALFVTYPDRNEGELTSFRAALVRTESLAKSAESLSLGEHILMSKGEEATGGRNRPYILANTVEAVIGAIYLDGGLQPSTEFITNLLIPKLPEIVAKRLDIDPKSRLQELAQELFKFTPIYEVVGEEGPDHDRVFTVKAIVKDEDYGVGKGKSKQEAEQNAARSALKKLEK
jgi:ribonuclease-3